MLMNGDWRQREIQHYITEGQAPIDRAALVKKMVAGLSYALVGKKPAMWARHRWTGCELAVEELGLMESIHQLLSTTYFRFLQMVGKARAPLAPPSGVVAGELVQENLNVTSDDAPAPGLVPQLPEAAEPSLPDGTEQEETTNELSDFAQVNAAYRSKAVSWLRGEPLDFLYLSRLVMEPLRVLMQTQFHNCSETWELSQRSTLAQAMKAGDPETPSSRTYMITLAALWRA